MSRIVFLQKAVNAVVEAGGNKTAAAETLGIPRTTLNDRLAEARRTGVIPSIEAPDVEAKLAEAEYRHTQEVRSLERQLRAATTNAVTEEAIRNVYLELGGTELAAPRWLRQTSRAVENSAGVPTLFLSDYHWGEVVSSEEVNGQNTYNPEIARERHELTINRAVDLCKNHMVGNDYPGIVVALGGDMVSGEIHPEITATNSGSVLEQLFEVGAELKRAITYIADEFGAVFVPTAFGNHARTTFKPGFKQAAKNNVDWALYMFLASLFKDDDRVTIHVPKSFDSHFRIFDTSYLLTHGDRLGVAGGSGEIGMLSPIARGVKRLKAQYSDFNIDIDYVMMGHYHHRLRLPDAMVNGSIKGYDEFAMGMRFSPQAPQQALWFTHPRHGVTFECPIFSGEVAPAAHNPWVAWKPV